MAVIEKELEFGLLLSIVIHESIVAYIRNYIDFSMADRKVANLCLCKSVCGFLYFIYWADWSELFSVMLGGKSEDVGGEPFLD